MADEDFNSHVEKIKVNQFLARIFLQISLWTTAIGVVGIGIGLLLNRVYHLSRLISIIPLIICVPIVLVINIITIRKALIKLTSELKKKDG